MIGNRRKAIWGRPSLLFDLYTVMQLQMLIIHTETQIVIAGTSMAVVRAAVKVPVVVAACYIAPTIVTAKTDIAVVFIAMVIVAIAR